MVPAGVRSWSPIGIAASQRFSHCDAAVTGRPLPNRETVVRKWSKVPVDSVVYQSELHEDRSSTSTRRTSRSATLMSRVRIESAKLRTAPTASHRAN
jgi:hypothetical protein